MKVKCTVIAEIFKSEETGYIVFVGSTEEGNMHFVGNALDIKVGDELSLEGAYDNHSRYGRQFKFTKYEKEMPKDEKSLIKYIATAGVKGIGEATAKRIVDAFSLDAIDVIRYKPEYLLDVRGITEEKAIELSDSINAQWEKWNLVSFLQKYDISVSVANKIYEKFENDSVRVVKKNPYILLSAVRGLDFKVVDKIGRAMGIALDNEERVGGGIQYVLRKVVINGHTCALLDDFMPYTATVLGVSQEVVRNQLTKLMLDKEVYIEKKENEQYIFSAAFYTAELLVAQKLAAMAIEKPLKKNYEKDILAAQEYSKITLSSEQIEAVNNALKNRVSIITGGPGTGKSTIIKFIIDILERENKKYVLCAPTGRAAKRIKETTGVEAKTMHRLLEIVKLEEADDIHMLEYNVKKIEADYVIVDEVSMVDILLMNNLMKAIKSKTRLILVGDVDQLPSVGPGSVLQDLIETEKIVTTKLKEIYRQSKQSDIIINSHKVNKGEYPEFKEGETDLVFVEAETIEETIKKVKELVEYELQNYMPCDILKDMQLLTPMKKTDLGSIFLNRELQEILNPHVADEKEKENLGRKFRVGDKVMQMENNYDIQYRQGDIEGEGVFNGDIGYITDIDKKNSTLTVLFEDEKEVQYGFSELEQLELAYAITVHKSQGSEFDVVILPLCTGYRKLFTRNLLYTAMTRAKKLLVVVGRERTINFMVDNVDEKSRKTGLKEKVIKYVDALYHTM